MTKFELPARLRKTLATAFAVLFCLILVSQNMPPSHTKTKLTVLEPVTRSLGMLQGWGVFAPNPLRLEVETYAVVSFADGSSEYWDPKTGSFWLGSPRYERWRKISTRLRRDSHNALWQPNARNIAEEMTTGDKEAVRVQLVRRWSTTPLPGEGFEREPGEFVFYDYDVASDTGAMLGSQYQQTEVVNEPAGESNNPENEREGVPLPDEPAPIDVDEDPAPSVREPIDAENPAPNGADDAPVQQGQGE